MMLFYEAYICDANLQMLHMKQAKLEHLRQDSGGCQCDDGGDGGAGGSW